MSKSSVGESNGTKARVQERRGPPGVRKILGFRPGAALSIRGSRPVRAAPPHLAKAQKAHLVRDRGPLPAELFACEVQTDKFSYTIVSRRPIDPFNYNSNIKKRLLNVFSYKVNIVGCWKQNIDRKTAFR